MSELVVADSGIHWTQSQVDLIKTQVCHGITIDELKYFYHVCNRTGLDPFARQIYAVKRYDSRSGGDKMTIQTSIDGFRLIAERSGKYGGQLGPFWCGADGVWVDFWIKKESPLAAKVGVIRHDFKEPLWGSARTISYMQSGKNGPLGLWSKMPELMIAKCAEALALRRAFPLELSGIYTTDEMSQSEQGKEDKAPAPTIETPPPPATPESLSPKQRLIKLIIECTKDLELDNQKIWAKAVLGHESAKEALGQSDEQILMHLENVQKFLEEKENFEFHNK